MSIKIQRGSFDFGATEDTDTVTLGTAVASLGVAFARITGVRSSSSGPAAGTTGDRNNDDLGVTCLLTATDTITFTRESSGDNEDVRVYWEVIEGPATGPHAIAVRYHDNVTMAGAVTQIDQAVSGISTLADCVPFICGAKSNYPAQNWSRVQASAKMVDASGDKVRLDRVDGTNTTVVSVAVVEFTGSAWTVQNNVEHNYTAAGANETETITDVVDTSHAFVVCAHRSLGGVDDELGYNCWFKDSDELYFRIHSGASAPSSDYTVAHVVRNDSLTVEHLDSITGGETDHPAGSASPQSLTTSVTAVSDMAQTSLFASADDGGGSIDSPRPHWLYRLTDTDEVTWWRGRYGTVAEWALQVVDFSGLTQQELVLLFTTETEDPKTLAVVLQTPRLTVARGALRTFRLDAAGDLDMVGGRTVTIEGAEAAVQVIKGLLEVHVGEWLYDLNYGVPHLTEYHSPYPNVAAIYASVRSKIEALWFIRRVELLEFDTETDPEVLDVSFRVRLVDGTAATGEARV